MRNKRAEYPRRGFTLVEVLIVVVILGILAATVLPQFTSASSDTKEAALMQNLQVLRSQIENYKLQHNDRYPGQGSTDPQDFKDALLLSSDADGTVGPLGTLPYGPYLIGQFPPNPFNGGRGVKIVSDVESTTPDESEEIGDDKVGWIYNPETGEIKANCEGIAQDGTPLHEL